VAGEPAGALAADPRPPIPPQAGPEPAPADRDRELDLDAINSLWPSVIETIRGDNAMLAALLEGARPVALHADELRLAFPESAAFLKRKAEDVRNRQAAGRALEAVAGRSLRLSYELRADEDAGPDGDGPAMTADELVARLMEEFDAEELRPDRDEEPATAERDE
jgi:hypothetical protein